MSRPNSSSENPSACPTMAVSSRTDRGEAIAMPTCSGAVVLPEGESAEFARGFRQVTLWLSIPVAVLVGLVLLLA